MTNDSFVPTAMYTDFKYLLEAAVLKAGLTVITGTNEWLPPWIDSEYDICYTGSRTWNTEILLQQFPKLTIHYTGNMTLNLFPQNYLFRHSNRHAFCLGIFDGMHGHPSFSANIWWGILLGQNTLQDTFVEFDMDNYQVNMAATNCAALRKKYTKALPSGSDDFPVFVTTSLLQLLAAVGAGLSVWLLAWLLAWGMRLVIRRARARHRRMGWRRLEDELDTQIEMGDVAQSRDIEKRYSISA